MISESRFSPIAKNAVDSALLLLMGWCAAVLLLSSLTLIVGIGITPYHALASALITILGTFAWLRWKEEKPAVALSIGIVIAVGLFALSYQAAGIFYDFSYDGQHYHQEAVLGLSNGWNPVWQPQWEIGDTGSLYQLKHYPAGAWYLAQSVFTVTGSLEHSKMFSILFAILAIVAAYQFLRTLKIGRTLSAALGTLIALSPTTILQMCSFLVDGIMMSLFVIFCCQVLDVLYTRRTERLPLLVLTTIILFTIKTTGPVFSGAVIGIVLVSLYLFAQGKYSALLRPLTISTAAMLLLGIVVAGFHPYVTNTLCCGHPLYPFNKINTAAESAPAEFIAQSRGVKLAYAIFAKPALDRKTVPVLKAPFTVDSSDLAALRTFDVPYGGLGPLFGSAMLLVPLAGWLVWRRSRNTALASLAISGVLLVTVLIIPDPWMIRFVPQLWLLPLVWAIALATLDKRLPERAVFCVLTGILLINQGLILWQYLDELRTLQERLIAQIDDLKQQSHDATIDIHSEWDAQKYRFEQMGLTFSWTPELSCPSPQIIVGTDGITKACVVEKER